MSRRKVLKALEKSTERTTDSSDLHLMQPAEREQHARNHQQTEPAEWVQQCVQEQKAGLQFKLSYGFAYLKIGQVPPYFFAYLEISHANY